MKQLVVRISGGLGNQMFEYALGLAVSKKAGRSLRLDLTDFLIFRNGRTYQLGQFRGPRATRRWRCFSAAFFLCAWIINKRVSKKWAARVLQALSVRVVQTEHIFEVDRTFMAGLESATETTLCIAGCYGVLPYIADASASIREAFALTDDFYGINKVYHEQISHSASAVSIHIRRTDYLMASNGSPVLDFSYYDRAITAIQQRVENPQWFVFSDDIPWCKESFASLSNVIFVEGNEQAPWFDIHLIAACRHHIIANSTFSWWGAFLSRDLSGVTIYPQTWFRGQPTTSDMVLPAWLPVPSFE